MGGTKLQELHLFQTLEQIEYEHGCKIWNSNIYQTFECNAAERTVSTQANKTNNRPKAHELQEKSLK